MTGAEPSSIKGVITQKWQFSWFNKRVVPDIHEHKAYDDAEIIARMSLDLYNSMAQSEGCQYNDLTKGATHYFATWSREPSWAPKMKYLGTVGQHKLYRDY